MANAQLLNYLEQLSPRKANGTLNVQNPDSGDEGSIGISNGIIVAASTPRYKDRNAVACMLAWENASVLWFEDQTTPILSCELDIDLAIFEFVQLEIEHGSSAAVLIYLDSLAPETSIKKRRTIRLPDLTNFSIYLQMENDTTGQSDFELREGTLLIGKGKDCDIVLTDASVSRRHCQAALIDRTITLTDLGSTNGTYVNDQLIHQEFIVPGDKITVGSTYFLVAARMRRNLTKPVIVASKPTEPKNFNTMKIPKNTQALHWQNLNDKKTEVKPEKSLIKRFLSK